jgi:hypothetical protein
MVPGHRMLSRLRSKAGHKWLAALSIYALVLHGPAMAAVEDPAPTATERAEAEHHAGHDHGGVSGSPESNSCCASCALGACAAAPVGDPAPILVLPRQVSFVASIARGVVPQRADAYFFARGPPATA